MGQPSEEWSGFADLSPGTEKYDQIKSIMSTANFTYLENCAINARRTFQAERPPALECAVNRTQFTSGRQNLILRLTFSDRIDWIVRIPYCALDEDTKTSLLSEVATMKLVCQRTSIPVPQIFHFEISTKGGFGHPFILMECIRGRVLSDGLAIEPPPQHRLKVATQFASIFAQLQTLKFDNIGRIWCGESADSEVEVISMNWHHSPGPLHTSLEYFYNQRQGENREMITLHPNEPDWLTACWVLKSALAHMIIEDRVRGPFPLCHMDLHFGNLLYDEDFNLVGVIDWSNVQSAPLEQLSASPEFMTFPGAAEDVNGSIIAFKKLVIQALQKMEANSEHNTRSEGVDVDTNQDRKETPLSSYLATTGAEITLRQYLSTPRSGLFAGKTIAKLIYGTKLDWAQLKEIYGTMPLS